MTRHPELPERDRRILAEWSRPTSSRASRSPRSGWPAAASGCRLPRCAASWPGWKNRAMSASRTRRPGASRPIWGIAATWTGSWRSGGRRGLRPQVEERLRRAGTVEDVLSHASQEISRASHQVALRSRGRPTRRSSIWTSCRSTAAKMLVVLVSGRRPHLAQGHRAGRAVSSRRAAAGGQLPEHASSRGCSLSGVRQQVLDRLREERTLYDQLMARALRLASTTFEGLDPKPSIFIQGTSLVFDMAPADDPETTLATMRTLVRMMEEKTRLVQLIDACMDGKGLTVVIGSEHLDPDLQRLSVVTSTYVDGRRTSAVGVIGPTRMRYSRAINAVDSLSRAINRVLENS